MPYPYGQSIALDIETTGFSKEKNQCYMIGYAQKGPKGESLLTQLVADNANEEPALLNHFADLLSDAPRTLITFNGDRFDIPFLRSRYGHHGLEYPESFISNDLYLMLRPIKKIFGLSAFKQTSLEKLMELPKRTYPDGKEGIKLYHAYESMPLDSFLNKILGHNEEDIKGLLSLAPLLLYIEILNGAYDVTDFHIGDTSVTLDLKWTILSYLPLECTFSVPEGSLYMGKDHGAISAPLYHGRTRLYHADYKNYDYIATEDTAIPKALSSFMDRSLRRFATPSTCYTWFSPKETFSAHPGELSVFAQSLINYIVL